MDKLFVEGGRPLSGRLRVAGAKNSALPIIASTILTSGTTILHDVPRITDIDNLLKMLSGLGCSVRWQDKALYINTDNIRNNPINDEIARKIRGSVFVLGALVARFKIAKLPFPGGCAIGERPIDIHLNAFKDIGITTREQGGYIIARRVRSPKIAITWLDFPSVGATINLILASALGTGTRKIMGCAKEPEIIDLCNFLNRCGACIAGAGTDTITISATRILSGTKHSIMPDRIATGSYIALVAATGGDVILDNTIPSHNQNLILKLGSARVGITTTANEIRVQSRGQAKALGSVQTAPYPGFSTDLQSQVAALALTTKGRTTITENLFENRFGYASGFEKLGGKVIQAGKKIIISGGEKLTGGTEDAPIDLHATDLRGGFALIMAALCADGHSVIHNAQYVHRGYQNLVADLVSLGAKVTF